MENFKNYLENKNMEEIEILLKNSSVDLLKNIAKRYKLPVSTKKKELIISSIIQAVKSDKSFGDEPALHVMTISQLKNKALQLNIDISSLKLKQDYRKAILNKMNKIQGAKTNQETKTESKTQDVSDSITFLESKSLTYLKTLAKEYKIKISKLGKQQLITSIIDAQTKTGKSVASSVNLNKDIKSMKKNELILKAQELGLDYKNKSKEELITLISSSLSDFIEPDQSEVPKKTVKKTVITEEEIVTSVPISKDAEQNLIKNKKITIQVIKDILKKFHIDIPKKITKRNDLIHLLVIQKSSQIVVSSPIISVSPTPLPLPSPSQPPSQPPTIMKSSKPSLTIDTDIVSLDDIQTPFSPVAIHNLLDEPSEKQIQEELYRCLSFYEHPK